MGLILDSEVILTAQKPVVGGRMLARHQGQVSFVAGEIPGECVRARVERVGRQLAYAETLEVLDPSPDRRSSDVDRACGGSHYAHIAYRRQLSLKSALVVDAFARIAKITIAGEVPIAASQEQGFRMRARLHARNGRFGFFREGTHELCDPGATQQLLPETLAVFDRLRSALGAKEVERVLSCELSENIPADERTVLLEMDQGSSRSLHVEAIDGLTGLAFVDHDNVRPRVAYGSPYVTDRVEITGNAMTLTRHVQSFFQGNRYLLPGLAGRVLELVPDGDVTDLYAGVGLFAVALAASGRTGIVAVEGDRPSARDLETNAAPYAGAIAIEYMPVEGYLQRHGIGRTRTVVVDPTRTGISREAVSSLIGLKPSRVVYVSCDPATVARDVKRFVEGGYRLAHIEALDLFPNTAHVETVVVLER